MACTVLYCTVLIFAGFWLLAASWRVLFAAQTNPTLAVTGPNAHIRLPQYATAYLLPPSVEEWLPEDHLARFIVEVVDGLDVSRLEKAYRGGGSAAYHPALLLSLLV